jgi:hypothetical protein
MRWAWVNDGEIGRIRVHVACNEYAHDRLAAHTDEGVDDNAVENDIRDRVETGNSTFDAVEAQEIIESYPGLSALVSRIQSEIEEQS